MESDSSEDTFEDALETHDKNESQPKQNPPQNDDGKLGSKNPHGINCGQAVSDEVIQDAFGQSDNKSGAVESSKDCVIASELDGSAVNSLPAQAVSKPSNTQHPSGCPQIRNTTVTRCMQPTVIGDITANTVNINTQKSTDNLARETEATFREWTEGMVWTRATQTVLEKISQGKTWITITGCPGEGKTTAGYLVLKHLHGMGRQVFDIKSPEDYFKVKDAKQPILMLNDIFGASHFDCDQKMNRESLYNMLTDILALKEHKGETKDQEEDARQAPTVILISRSSVLKAVSHHLSRFRDIILKDDCVIDLTAGIQTQVEERREIWKYHSEKYKIQIDEKTVNEVCKMPLGPHGFPHCCRLFAAMYSVNKHLSMVGFFSSPIKFLNQTMESYMKDDKTGPLLREMLKNDGTLHLDEDDDKSFQYATTAETLRGTYLSRSADTITFHHHSVYDSAAFVLCTTLPSFVIKNCTLQFMNERLRFRGLELEPKTEVKQTVTIDNTYTRKFLDRLKTEFDHGNLSQSLSHESFHDKHFVSEFMRLITRRSDLQPLPYAFCQVIHTNDNTTKESFLFLQTKSGSDKLLKYVCDFVRLSFEDQKEIVFGICEHSSVASMRYFLIYYDEFNLNVRNDIRQTPLLLASTKCSREILKLLLKRNIDINATDKAGSAALHNICQFGVGGNGDAVKILLEKGADVNMQCKKYPFLPLHIACREGHRNVVLALIDFGVDVNQRDKYGDTPLTHASRMGHGDIEKILFDASTSLKISRFGIEMFSNMSIQNMKSPTNMRQRQNDSPLDKACSSGQIGIIGDLLNKGADINKADIHGDTPLHKACREGFVNVVTLLVDRGSDINRANNSGNTPLHVALVQRHLDVAGVLMGRDADTNLINNHLDSPLHIACRQGQVDIVHTLLDRGSNINKQGSHGKTPLNIALSKEHMHIATVLLDRGAEISQTDNDGCAPLHIACYYGYEKLVTVFLDNGSCVNLTDRDGDTPLHKSSYRGHVSVVKALLEREADIDKPNSDGYTPLHTACYVGHADVVTVLLEKGADINKVSSVGYTPLHIASEKGHVDVLSLLLDEEAVINRTEIAKETPLLIAASKGHVDAVTLLLDRGEHINVTNIRGISPLHAALIKGHMGVVTVLSSRGADLNLRDQTGDTSLHVACFVGHTDFVRDALDTGVDIHETGCDGETFLHKACFNGHVDTVRVLLVRGADINKVNNKDETPLHKACFKGHKDMVTLLLDREANINQPDTRGNTPLHFACFKRHEEVIYVLLHRGADVHKTNFEGTSSYSVAQRRTFWGNGDLKKAFTECVQVS